VFDVTDEEAVVAGVKQVAAALDGAGLDVLVNNAGMTIYGPLMFITNEELRRQFDVNVLGLMNVTRAALPLLGARPSHGSPSGRIVNISSTGGRVALPFLGAYAASKHAIEALSDVLRRELQIWGIDVIVIQPGAVNTSIWDKGEKEDLSRYDHTAYGPLLDLFRKSFTAYGRAGLAPEVVGRFIQRVVETPRPKARYALVGDYITGWMLPRVLPDRWLDKMLAARTGLSAQARA
jgi:NAD(P)-dependent dehydrogenase (short-subunit alcohol dehydrogenase family)